MAHHSALSREVYAHSTALVETDQIGRGTRIWAFAHVMEGASIGADCNIGDHCFVEAGASIGNLVTIKNGNMIWAGVTLEDGVFVGPHVFFTNDLYPRSPRLPQARKRYEDSCWLQPTAVRKGASLGAGAVILAGVTIGEFAMIGAGAVVTRDVVPHALVLGNPARLRGWVCQCGQPLQFQNGSATCAKCQQRYFRNGDLVRLATS
jgi:UDP-2-acetamido-3-amino-2,3-dideoxy-glucuronate N-acetyltransferase